MASTWTTGLSAPTGLVANDLSHVAFLVRFKVDGNCVVALVEGGGGGELGGVAISCKENNISLLTLSQN